MGLKRLFGALSFAVAVCAHADSLSDAVTLRTQRAIYLNVHCHIECAHAPTSSTPWNPAQAFAHIYTPARQDLPGSMPVTHWGTLGASLWIWGQDVCFHDAEQPDACGKNNIQEARLDSLESGGWTQNQEPSCAQNAVQGTGFFARKDVSLLSPYDTQSKAVLTPPGLAQEEIHLPGPGAARESSGPRDKHCDIPISGHLCLGDCYNPVNGVCALCTNQPGGIYDRKFCVDDKMLDKFLADSAHFSAETAAFSEKIENECKKVFWESLRTPQNQNLTSCAASRATIQCTDVVAAVKSRRLGRKVRPQISADPEPTTGPPAHSETPGTCPFCKN